jgi:hypothetical protein
MEKNMCNFFFNKSDLLRMLSVMILSASTFVNLHNKSFSIIFNPPPTDSLAQTQKRHPQKFEKKSFLFSQNKST